MFFHDRKTVSSPGDVSNHWNVHSRWVGRPRNPRDWATGPGARLLHALSAPPALQLSAPSGHRAGPSPTGHSRDGQEPQAASRRPGSSESLRKRLLLPRPSRGVSSKPRKKGRLPGFQSTRPPSGRHGGGRAVRPSAGASGRGQASSPVPTRRPPVRAQHSAA